MQTVTIDAETMHRTLGVNIPTDDDFGGEDYILAPNIENIGNGLIDQYDELAHLKRATIVYVWKRKGGKSKGKLRYGACQHPTGLLAFFGSCDFVVALSADHCRDADLDGRQIEALTYHELRHAGYEIDEQTGEIAWTVVGHDWEGFRGEIDRYGLWEPELARLGETFKQSGLF